MFDSFVAQVGPNTGPSDWRKFCQLLVELHYPQGFQYSIAHTEFRGYIDIDPGITGEQEAIFYFSGGEWFLLTLSIYFPTDWEPRIRTVKLLNLFYWSTERRLFTDWKRATRLCRLVSLWLRNSAKHWVITCTSSSHQRSECQRPDYNWLCRYTHSIHCRASMENMLASFRLRRRKWLQRSWKWGSHHLLLEHFRELGHIFVLFLAEIGSWRVFITIFILSTVICSLKMQAT